MPELSPLPGVGGREHGAGPTGPFATFARRFAPSRAKDPDVGKADDERERMVRAAIIAVICSARVAPGSDRVDGFPGTVRLVAGVLETPVSLAEGADRTRSTQRRLRCQQRTRQ